MNFDSLCNKEFVESEFHQHLSLMQDIRRRSFDILIDYEHLSCPSPPWTSLWKNEGTSKTNKYSDAQVRKRFWEVECKEYRCKELEVWVIEFLGTFLSTSPFFLYIVVWLVKKFDDTTILPWSGLLTEELNPSRISRDNFGNCQMLQIFSRNRCVWIPQDKAITACTCCDWEWASVFTRACPTCDCFKRELDYPSAGCGVSFECHAPLRNRVLRSAQADGSELWCKQITTKYEDGPCYARSGLNWGRIGCHASGSLLTICLLMQHVALH